MARIAEVYLSTLSAIMKPHGLERNFTAFVYLCEHSGKLTQNDLAIAMHKDKVSIMRTIDYLCELGYVKRKPDAGDRRCHLLEVTAKAKKLLPTVEAAIKKTNQIMLREFTAKQITDFEKGMGLLMNVVSSMPEPDFRIEAVKMTKK